MTDTRARTWAAVCALTFHSDRDARDHLTEGAVMTDPHPPTHDWHVGTDGMELLIRRDEQDTVGVHLGHENIDDAHATTIVTSRLLEMIDAVQPGAVRDHLREQEPTDAEVEAAAMEIHDLRARLEGAQQRLTPHSFFDEDLARAALAAARATRRGTR